MNIQELKQELKLIEAKLLITDAKSIEYHDLMLARDIIKTSIIWKLEHLLHMEYINKVA